MTKLGNKEGLATKEEIKVLWKIVSGELPVPKLLKPLLDMVAPGILDRLENKVGDRIPEPWQSYCENLITMAVIAVEDKVVTQEEAEEIALYAAKVSNEQIDLKILGDDLQALMFEELFRLLATVLFSVFTKKKAA
jgi:hypothetical protein